MAYMAISQAEPHFERALLKSNISDTATQEKTNGKFFALNSDDRKHCALELNLMRF